MIRKKIIFTMLTLFMTLNLVALHSGSVSAAVDANCSRTNAFLFFPTWYKYLDIGPKDGDDCAIIGPLKDDGSNELDWEKASGRVALAVIEIMLRVATLVAVGYVILGGVRFITTQGEPDNAKSARQTIINALIGLVISLLAAAIVAFIANRLSS